MAKEYIERDVVLSHKWEVRSYDPADPDPVTEVVSVSSIMQIPAADVVEVKHGRWIEDGYYGEPCVCSNCGEPYKDTVMGKPRWNYCPNCGARFDGGKDA